MTDEVRPHGYLGRRVGDVNCIAFNFGVRIRPMDCSVVVEPYSARTFECVVALWGDTGAVKHRQDLNHTEGYVWPRGVHGELVGFILSPFLARP